MAPEVLAQSQVSTASDVYSFGVVLWQMLSSRRPWEGLGCDAVREQVVHRGVELQLPGGLPEGVALLCRRCLARQPSARPEVGEVQRALQQLLQQLSPEPLLQDF
jgi:sterile alpha motif and leucine zipper-containing kinase AZK